MQAFESINGLLSKPHSFDFILEDRVDRLVVGVNTMLRTPMNVFAEGDYGQYRGMVRHCKSWQDGIDYRYSLASGEYNYPSEECIHLGNNSIILNCPS